MQIIKKRLREKRKDAGLCVSCGKVAPRPQHTRCEECAGKHISGGKLRYKSIRENGCCAICKRPSLETNCAECKSRHFQTQKDLRQHRKNNGLCCKCGIPIIKYVYCVGCRKKIKKSNIVAVKKVYEYYGGAKCSCCGETQFLFLSIDHINNNGAEHRRELKHGKYTTGVAMARWLIANNYPDGFQILCMNCNLGKQRNGGICPHKGVQ